MEVRNAIKILTVSVIMRWRDLMDKWRKSDGLKSSKMNRTRLKFPLSGVIGSLASKTGRLNLTPSKSLIHLNKSLRL